METVCADQQQKPQISTFVFFDLETTGLTIDNQTKITELSMVAVDRQSLLDSQQRHQLPRVMNKLLVPINPIRAVPPIVFELTGLDNMNLQFQKDFDDDLSTLVNAFLHRLRPPVCLVAHNGYRFDFPFLLKELIGVSARLPQSLLCVDSLVAFRACDWSSVVCLKNKNEVTPAKRLITRNAETPEAKRRILEDDVRSGTVPDVVRELFPEKQASGTSEGVTYGNATSFYWSDLAEIMDEPWVDEEVMPSRPSKNSLNLEVGNGLHAGNEHSDRTLSTSVKGNTQCTFSERIGPRVECNTLSNMRCKPVSMKLCDVFEFVVGRPPDNAHSAEDDSLSLLRIAQRIADWFCSWADQNAMSFASTEIKFDVKKSSNLDRGCFPCDSNTV